MNDAPIFDALRHIVVQAGWVGTLLVVVSLLMWMHIARRIALLRPGFRGPLASWIDACLTAPPVDHAAVTHPPLRWFVRQASHVAVAHPGSLEQLDTLVERASNQLAFGRAVLRALVAAAPLLGLLGTVDGMIETFGSLHGGALALSQRGSVAGGISTALISTQLGLTIGVPGLVVAKGLEVVERTRIKQLYRARALIAQRMMARP